MSRFNPYPSNEIEVISGGKYFVEDYPIQIPEVDDTGRINRAISGTPIGSTLVFSIKEYIVSSQLLINKNINILGNGWSHKRIAFGNQNLYGTKILVKDSTSQQTMESVIKVTSDFVNIKNLLIKGTGAANGSIGMQIFGISSDKTHAVNIDCCYVVEIGEGIVMDAWSDHVSVFNSQITGCTYGISFRKDCHFDYYFENCLFDGNIVASVRYPADYTVVNVTFMRCHLGFSDYGVIQDSTTTGDGAVGLTLIDTPIEYIKQGFIKLINGGNIRIQGGYWVWHPSVDPSNANYGGVAITNPAFEINRLNSGALWISPRLESISNPNSPHFIKVSTFHQYPIYIDVRLGTFCAAMYSSPSSSSSIFLDGKPFGGDGGGADGVSVTSTESDQTILSLSVPESRRKYSIRVFIKVDTACDVTIKVTYNNGSSLMTETLQETVSKAAGDYYYDMYIRAANFAPITILAKTSVSGAFQISASIKPEI